MAQKYEVQYQIHVDEQQATLALKRFQAAVQNLSHAKTPNVDGIFGDIAAAYNKAKEVFATPISVAVTTDAAVKEIAEITSAYNTLRSASEKAISIGVNKTDAIKDLNYVSDLFEILKYGSNLVFNVDVREAKSRLESVKLKIKSFDELSKFILGMDVEKAQENIAAVKKDLVALKSEAEIDIRVGDIDKFRRDMRAARKLVQEKEEIESRANKKTIWSRFFGDMSYEDRAEIERTKAIAARAKYAANVVDIDERKVVMLERMQAALRKINNAINNLPDKAYEPKVKVDTAINSLNRLEEKLDAIREKCSITITASAAGVSGAVQVPQDSEGGTTVLASEGGNKKGNKKGSGKNGKRAGSTVSSNDILGHTYVGAGTSLVGDVVKGIGVSYGFGMVTSGLMDAFNSATQYENITATTKNILGANDNSPDFNARFKRVNEIMRNVGIETKFTAPEVASAGKFLAMAGFGAEDISQAINPISNIALIGDTELGETADVVTNIMTAYEIPARNMNRVADILTMTFTNTNTSLMEMAEAFKYAGTVARQSGLSFEQTSAAIGILGDAGIKASQAGTTIRMMLMNMQKPTKQQKEALEKLGIQTKDANGNLKDFVTLMKEFNKASERMSRGQFTSLFYQAFRITAASGALALARNSEKLERVSDLNTHDSFGLAKDLADKKKNTVEGLVKQIESAFTEGGMQGFEKLQTEIKVFLASIVEMLKTPEFIEGLTSGMKTILDMGKMLFGVFGDIVKVWNMVPDFAKTTMVYFAQIQLYTTAIAGGVRMILGVWKGIKGVMLGRWLQQLINLIPFISKKYKHGPGYDNNAGSSVGDAVGGAIEDAAGGAAEKGMTTLLGLIKSHPIISTFAAIAVGAGSAVMKILELRDAYQKAAEANQSFVDSMRHSGVFDMDVNEPYALEIANLRLFNNEMLTEQERLRTSTELWKKYWKSVHGVEDDDGSGEELYSASKSKAAETFNENLKYINEFPFFMKSRGYLSSLFDGMSKAGITSFDNGKHDKQGNLVFNVGGFQYKHKPDGSAFEQWRDFQLFMAAIDANAPELVKLENEIRARLKGASSAGDLEGISNVLKGEYIKKASLSSSDMSDKPEEWTSYQIYNNEITRPILNKRNEKYINEYIDRFSNILKASQQGGVSLLDLNNFLSAQFDLGFFARGTELGSAEWVNKLQQHINKNLKAATATEVAEWINNVLARVYDFQTNSQFAQSTGMFNSLDVEKLWETLGKLTYKGTNIRIDKGWEFFYYNWPSDKNKNKNNAPSEEQGAGATEGTSTIPDDNDSRKVLNGISNGGDNSKYKSHYETSSAPKQVIVNIENLMKVDKQEIDMNDGRQVAALSSLKQELATMLLDVVQDFNSNI